MTALGKHILVELYGCTPHELDNKRELEALALDAVDQSGATILTSQFRSFGPRGVTGVVLITESHLALHTWPEHGYAALDYFTCGGCVEPTVAIDVILEALQPVRHERIVHSRGVGFGSGGTTTA
jgi:S-adenosylmethionine decarboxylase proenzyme